MNPMNPMNPTNLEHQAKDSSEGQGTVLLVDDDDSVRDVIRTILQAIGYVVLEASHGDGALHIARQYKGPIHLLLTDVVMPLMNGCELVERSAPIRPETKVLFMSGYTDPRSTYNMLKAGKGFLRKPFTASSLASKVREALEGGESVQELTMVANGN